MGGIGSGSWKKPNSKLTVESQYRIAICQLKKKGYILPGKTGLWISSRNGKRTDSLDLSMEADHMVLNYWHRPRGGEWGKVDQIIYLDRTPCNYGGHRTWFLCPGCWKRVAVLYRAGKYFRCRHCYGLTYSSQKKNRMARLGKKVSKIRMRMGGDGNLLDPFPDKPKNMQWKTYFRLRRESERARELWFLMAGHQIRSVTNKLNTIRVKLGLEF
jgi:hypothetical protein